MDVASVSAIPERPAAPPTRVAGGSRAPVVSPEDSGLSGAERQAVARLRRNEALIRAQESDLRARGGDCVRSVRYVYAVGPDGNRYVAAAEVRLEGPEEALRDLGESGGAVASGVRVDSRKTDAAEDARDEKPSGSSSNRASASVDRKATSPYAQTPETQRAIRELERIDREVRAHEAAHRAAGGAYAGAATFGYVQGPDGRSYAVSGEVPIHAPAGDTPEETARILSQVRAAALAPGDPSGPDMAVAASAAAGIAAAQAELASKRAEEAYSPQRVFSARREEPSNSAISLLAPTGAPASEDEGLGWVA